MHLLPIACVAVLPLLLMFAALRDVTSYTIPNWISVAAAAAFLPAALAAHLAPAQIALGLGAGGALLVAGIAMFALRWIGGGDAKLMAAAGVWLGWGAILPFLLWTAVVGGALAVTLLFARKLSVWLPAFAPAWLRRLVTPGENVPYGVAIAAGALAVFPTSPLAAALGHALR